MRRKDREVTSFEGMLEVVKANSVVRLGMDDGNGIYIVPVNYGYEAEDDKLCLYFHSGKLGRKAEALQGQVKSVAFEIDGKHTYENGGVDAPCNSTAYFECVMGQAEVVVLEDADEKKHALDLVMKNVFEEAPYQYGEKMINATLVVKLEVKEWSCKVH